MYIGTTKASEKQARCCQFKFVGGQWGSDEVRELKVPMVERPQDAIELVKTL